MLMLTARDAVGDRVAGPRRRRRRLPRQAVRAGGAARARARAAAPRRRRAPTRCSASPTSSSSPSRRRSRGGEAIELTRTEFNLLELFLRNPRQVLTRSVIFERVWGYDFGFASNSLDVYIGYLRPQDRGRRPPAPDPDGARRRLRAARAVSFRVRLDPGRRRCGGARRGARVGRRLRGRPRPARAEVDEALATARPRSRAPARPIRGRAGSSSLRIPRPVLGGAGGYVQVVEQAEGRRSGLRGARSPSRSTTRGEVAAGDGGVLTPTPTVEDGTHVRVLTFRLRRGGLRDPGRAAADRGRRRARPDPAFLIVIALAGIAVAAALGLLVSQPPSRPCAG